MELDRLIRDAEPRGDGLVRQAFGQELQDLGFAGSKRLEQLRVLADGVRGDDLAFGVGQIYLSGAIGQRLTARPTPAAAH